MPLLLGTCSASADRLIAYALVEEKEQRCFKARARRCAYPAQWDCRDRLSLAGAYILAD